MGKLSKLEKSFKSLTLADYEELLNNLDVTHVALSNLAYTLHKAGKGSLAIPLVRHEAIFKFTTMKHKVTLQQSLVIEVEEKEEMH